MGLMLIAFCCTLPFVLASAFGEQWLFLPSLAVSFCFFFTHASTSRIGSPFGFDTGHIPVTKKIRDFSHRMKLICFAVRRWGDNEYIYWELCKEDCSTYGSDDILDIGTPMNVPCGKAGFRA